MSQSIPIIVAFLTIGFGFLTYLFQKFRDRKEDLIKIRRLEYRKWIQAFYDVTSGKTDALLEFNKCTNDLFLYGSDEVVEAVGSFKNYMRNTSDGSVYRDIDEVRNLLAKVIREMRNDCFESTKLMQEDIRNILPIEMYPEAEDS